MKLVIVMGTSGAGKTIALKMLGSIGFYCVDNLPMSLMDKFAQLVSGDGDIVQAVLGIGIRSGEELNHPGEILRGWKDTGLDFQALFPDANDVTLIKRYKEIRRSHPLAGMGRLDKGIEEERIKLAFLKEDADFIIDTSKLLTKKLRQELEKISLQDREYGNVFATVLSSSFKYGIPEDADLVFDARFLPNLYYVEELRLLTGEDQVIRDYVMQGGTGQAFLGELYDMADFLLPNYIGEGKNQLATAVGCTGGKHRSVATANALYGHLAAFGEHGIKIEHRDIDKDNKRKQ